MLPNIWTGISNFFNSNFFVGLSTFITVGWAIFLYRFQKRQDKRQIAVLLVNEIRNAELAIQQLKERQPIMGDLPEISILPQNNWNKYSYLFTKDFFSKS